MLLIGEQLASAVPTQSFFLRCRPKTTAGVTSGHLLSPASCVSVETVALCLFRRHIDTEPQHFPL